MHKINLSSMVFSPPTFKTATPTSRTQLKLQLMREQLQEQERREAEFRQNLQQQRPTAAPPRPVPSTSLSTIGVDVPPQVLQVCLFYLVIACHASFFFTAVFRYPKLNSIFLNIFHVHTNVHERYIQLFMRIYLFSLDLYFLTKYILRTMRIII